MAEQNNETGQRRGIRKRLVFVTGASGGGRTTALRALEDTGFETIDNLPMRFVPRLLVDGPPDHPLALGIDVRTRGFSVEGLLGVIDGLDDETRRVTELLFLDSRPDILARRYSETRRRHPLLPDESPLRGIEAEIALLAPLRARADILIDTSNLTIHDLKAEIRRWLGAEGPGALGVTVQSFSYKRGVPSDTDLVFDVRFLRNPHWEPALRPLTGQSREVSQYVAEDPRYEEFVVRVTGLVGFLLPAYADEGKTHLSIGFGCTGGRHRSVALTETLAKTLADAGWQVSIRHRELSVARAGSAANGGTAV